MRSSQSFKYSTLHAIKVSHTIGTCHTIGICHSIGLLSYDWIRSCDTRAVLHDLILSELFHIFVDPNRHFTVWADVINIWKWSHKTFKTFIISMKNLTFKNPFQEWFDISKSSPVVTKLSFGFSVRHNLQDSERHIGLSKTT